MINQAATNKKRGFFAEFVTGGKVLYALLFIAIAFFAVLFNYRYNSYQNLYANKSLFAFVMVVFGIFAALTLAYLIISVKSESVTVADSLGITFIVFSILFAVYACCRQGSFDFASLSIKTAIFCICLFVIGIVYLIVRAKSFGKDAKCEGCCDYKCNISSYYKNIVKKYSFLSVIVIAFLLSCASYLILDYSFRKSVTALISSSPAIETLLIITAIIVAVYIAFSVSEKKVVEFDSILLGGGVALIVTLLNITIVNNSNLSKKITLWACITAVYILLTFMRYRSFKNKSEIVCDKDCKKYFKTLFSKYNPLLILSVACVAVSVFAVFFKGDLLNVYLPIVKGKRVPAVNFFPMIIVYSCIGITAITALLSSISTLFVKKIGVCDMFLALFEVLCVALLFVTFESSIYFIAAGILVNILSLCLIVARIRAYKEN